MPYKKSASKTLTAITEAEVAVLTSVLQKTTDFCQQIDSQANILIGLSLAIFVFASSTLESGSIHLYFLVLALFAALSALLGILVMHPPKFMRTVGGEGSMMFIKAIARHKDATDYTKTLQSTLASRDEIIRQFALENYNLSTSYYKPKRRLFNAAKDTLFVGITLSLIVFVVSFFIAL